MQFMPFCRSELTTRECRWVLIVMAPGHVSHERIMQVIAASGRRVAQIVNAVAIEPGRGDFVVGWLGESARVVEGWPRCLVARPLADVCD